MSGDRRAQVLIVDDERVIRAAWQAMLPADLFDVAVAEDGAEAIDRVESGAFDVVVADLMMPGGLSGMDVLRHVKANHPETEVVLMTAFATVETAVEALKAGAYDYMVKPFENIDNAVRVVERALDRKRLIERTRRLEHELHLVRNRDGFNEMVGSSKAMQAVMELAARVANTDATVLVSGESGTGKELVARSVHFRSRRAKGPWVPVNCGAIPETLIDSELFGHEKGAFTGADAPRKGHFEHAHGGTIFLDEIGEIPPATQVRLLRVLQEREIKRVGSNESKRVDVRVISATNQDLQALVKSGKFRQDLYFRLNVFPIITPALRDRPDDIPPLAYHFLRQQAELQRREIKRVEADTMSALQAYGWAGNVRELENVITRAVVMETGESLRLAALPPDLQALGRQRAGSIPPPDAAAIAAARGAGDLPYADARKNAVDRFERRYFTELLRKTQDNKAAAARMAGMDRANFRRTLKRVGLAEPTID